MPEMLLRKFTTHRHITMAKKSKLLAALDAHKGRDYKLEKQKKLQKQAAKKKRSHPTQEEKTAIEEKENLPNPPSGITAVPGIESDGWESDEEDAARPAPVRSHCKPISSIH